MIRIHARSLVGGRQASSAAVPSLAPFVKRLLARSELSSSEQQALLELPFRVKQVGRDRDFVALGQMPSHVSCVASGLVGRFEDTAGGKRQITGLYLPGDVPDLGTVVQPSAVSGLQALSPTTILEVSRSALRWLATANPSIMEALWRACAVDAVITGRWVTNIGRRDARSRIAHLICEMAWRSGAHEEGGSVTFRLPMTQTQLANATGLTPIHVNRSLMSLAPVGLRIRAGKVTIEDWDALASTAEFDESYLQVAEPERMCAILRQRPATAQVNDAARSASMCAPVGLV